jgi:hypothetical protein
MCFSISQIKIKHTCMRVHAGMLSVILLFYYYIPLEKGYSLRLNKLESPSTKDDLCRLWLNLAQWVWRKRFLNGSTPFFFFFIFVIISPLKRTWPFISTNLNSLHPKIICIKFDWIWSVGSGDFFLNCSVFLLFRYYLPLKKGYLLHLNKLKFPTPKNDLCQVWLKLAQWIWWRF